MEADGKFLLVDSDRISASDVVLPDGIPGKRKVLTQISAFWFRMLEDVVPNQMISVNEDEYLSQARVHSEVLRGRSMLCRRAKALPIECVVRGYLSGSGWAEYRQTGEVCEMPVAGGAAGVGQAPGTCFHPCDQRRYRET